MKRYSLLLLVMFLVCARSQDNQPPPAKTLPLSPGELLAYLPPPPSGADGTWALSRSFAYNEYETEWLISHAIRTYVFTPTPKPGVTAPTVPRKVMIKIDDTGFNPVSNLMFAYKAKGSQGDDPDSFPSISTTNGSSPVEIYWVGKRFIVTIRVDNAAGSGDAQQWLKLIDTAKLTSLPDIAVDKVPRPYDNIRVDELDPKNNFAAKGYYTTWEESQEATQDAKANFQKSANQH